MSLQKVFLCCFFVVIAGCYPQPTDEVIIQIKQHQVTYQNLPVLEQINLYESALTHHLLELETAQRQTKKQWTNGSDVEVLLTPPKSPSYSPDIEPYWQWGNPDSKLKISVICSYQSALCARFMQGLEALEPYLSDSYFLNYSNIAFPYHRFSQLAASAENCLKKQGQRLGYRKYLWLQNGNLTPNSIETGLMRQGLSIQATQSCVGNSLKDKEFLKYLDQVRPHFLSSEPSLWINDRYISLRHWEKLLFPELKPFLRLDSSTMMTEPSLKLSASWKDAYNTSSWAELVDAKQNTISIQQHAQLQNYWVYEITRTNAILFKNGSLFEVLPAISSSSEAAAQTSQNDDPFTEFGLNDTTQEKPTQEPVQQNSVQSDNSETLSDIEKHEQRYVAATKATTIYPLDDYWLTSQLIRQEELEKQLNPATHEIEGNPLLKLDSQAIDSFYHTLGMEPGDVIIRVNDEWVHANSNPMWNIMQTEEQFIISVIRKGLPVHLSFTKSDELPQ